MTVRLRKAKLKNAQNLHRILGRVGVDPVPDRAALIPGLNDLNHVDHGRIAGAEEAAVAIEEETEATTVEGTIENEAEATIDVEIAVLTENEIDATAATIDAVTETTIVVETEVLIGNVMWTADEIVPEVKSPKRRSQRP